MKTNELFTLYTVFEFCMNFSSLSRGTLNVYSLGERCKCALLILKRVFEYLTTLCCVGAAHQQRPQKPSRISAFVVTMGGGGSTKEALFLQCQRVNYNNRAEGGEKNKVRTFDIERESKGLRSLA